MNERLPIKHRFGIWRWFRGFGMTMYELRNHLLLVRTEAHCNERTIHITRLNKQIYATQTPFPVYICPSRSPVARSGE